MRFPSRQFLLAGLTTGFLLALAGTAFAAETASSELVIITEDDVVDGDLYAAGVRVLIEGVVEGDLVAFAAEEVSIQGGVRGSVLAVAPTVTVNGEIGGALRTFTRDLSVSGSVGTDLVAAAISANLDSSSQVGADVLLWAFDSVAAGSVGANLEGTQRSLLLEGMVGADVDVSVGRLSITGPLEVIGDFGYRSELTAVGLDHLTVGGVVVHKTPLPPNIRLRALALLARCLVVLGLTAAAILVAWAWPERTRGAGEKVRRQPLRAFGHGIVVMLSPLILSGVAAITAGLAPASAGLPLLAIFVPLVLVTVGVIVAVSLVAGVPAVLALGRSLPGDRGLFGATVLGSAVAGLIWLVPLLGWIVPLVILPLGLGGWLTSFRNEPER